MTTLSFKISQAEIEKLNYERFAYPHPMIQKRIFAVYLKATLNFPNQTIGLIADLHFNTVSHWVQVYQQKGYEGLLTNDYGTIKVNWKYIVKVFYHHFRNNHQCVPQKLWSELVK
jgi:hypothetical protein